MTVAEIYLDPFFIVYLLAQFVSYALLIRVFSGARVFCKKPIDIAYRFVAFPSFCFLGLYGGYLWFFDPGFQEAFADDKIFGFYEPARVVIHVMVGFMFFDTFHLIYAGGEVAMYGHHAVVFALGNLGLLYNGAGGDWYMLSYGVFFFGLCELSSVPLIIMGAFRQNADLAQEYPLTNSISRVTFAVFFVVLRILIWAWVMVDWAYNFFPSTSIAPLWAWIPFAITCIPLTFLQWYWGFLIVKGALGMTKSKTNLSVEVAENLAQQG